jgi:hypothetical protein
VALDPDTETLFTASSKLSVSEFALEFTVLTINTSIAMGLGYLLKDSGLL